MKQQYDFDQLVERKRTNSLKWEFMQRLEPACPADATPYWVADMDFPCAEPIVEAMRQRVENLVYGYSVHHTQAYTGAIAGWYQRRFDWTIPESQIFYSPGVVPALGFLIDMLTEPGDGVIIQTPVYYPFIQMVKNHQRKLVDNRLLDDNGYYHIDFEDLEHQAAKPENKLLLFCSPHNPVGRVWSEEELSRLVDICMRHDVLIISDEIHCDLIRREHTHLPLVKLFPEHEQRIITCVAPSKTFNLAGLQVASVILASPQHQQQWKRLVFERTGLNMPNPFAIVASEAAYNHGEPWLEQLIDYLDDNIQLVADVIQRHLPQVGFVPPEGSYLLWLDVRTVWPDSVAALVKKLAIENKVLIQGGEMFGGDSKGRIRINVACPRPLLEHLLTQLRAVLA